MIDIELTNEEKHLQPLIDEFNRLYKLNYPEILQWTHYELFSRSQAAEDDQQFSPQHWKEFLMNPKVKSWYEDEQDIRLRSSLMKVLDEIADGKSTGQAQTINTIFNQLNKREQDQNTVRYIYSFVPLTDLEKENPNINVLDFIPDEIRNAVQIIKPNTEPNDKE